MSAKVSDVNLDDVSDVDGTLMMLRKPTDIRKVIESIPKPVRAVPKNGLPHWYRMGLECTLPVPKMPKGKIIFSRGKIGEDVRRIGLGDGGPPPSFDLTDPYCRNITYEYVAMHDPHLTSFFCQKPARDRMKILGYCTKDGRAVCSLKEFNIYRRYLYFLFMDRIHGEMRHLDERARDDLTLKRVEKDVARRRLAFNRTEKAREQLERNAQGHAAEWAEKRRRAKEQERKIIARMKYLAEFNEQQRKERAARSYEKEKRIKERVHAAAEIELRRKITMLKTWRINEKNRLNRLKQEKETKQKEKEEDANNKWAARVAAQNQKIQEEALLLKVYTEDMTAAARRRAKKAEIYAYMTDLELQRIRLANLKLSHGAKAKELKIIRYMGKELAKSKGASPREAHNIAIEALSHAVSTKGDTLMTLGQARKKMDTAMDLPSAPVKLLEEMLEIAVTEFARSRVHTLLRDVERIVHSRAAVIFFQNYRPSAKQSGKKIPRWSAQIASELAKHYGNAHGGSINFGQIEMIDSMDVTELEMKSVKNRPPTPVPSKTKLLEVTFRERTEDLPDPVAFGTFLPERRKLLEMVNAAAKLLSRSVSAQVEKGMDLTIGSVTLPHMKHAMDWGEAVEGLSDAVLNNRVHADCADVRQVSVFLAHRILRRLLAEMKEEKRRRKNGGPSAQAQEKDFYVPEVIELKSATDNEALP